MNFLLCININNSDIGYYIWQFPAGVVWWTEDGTVALEDISNDASALKFPPYALTWGHIKGSEALGFWCNTIIISARRRLLYIIPGFLVLRFWTVRMVAWMKPRCWLLGHWCVVDSILDANCFHFVCQSERSELNRNQAVLL